ncbi:MAG: ATP-binding protein [Vicinamibacteraceae bacterium]
MKTTTVGSLSLQARLTIWCVAVVVAVVASFAVVVLITQSQIGLRRVDDELAATQAQLVKMLGEEMEEVGPPRAAEEAVEILSAQERPIAVLSAAGEILASRFEGPDMAAVWGGAAPRPQVTTIESRGDRWRVDVRRETLRSTAFILVVSSSLKMLARDQQDVRQALLVGIPLALLLAAGGGLWLASVGLRPISVMAGRAASLPLTGEDDLGPPVRNDELGQLTQAFNALVARLRLALRMQRQFMADASHELRNPVSVIRVAADVALSRPHRDEADYRETLEMTAVQSRRLSTLVDDMLVLARADAGGYPLRPVEFILDDVIDACRQAVGVLAAARGVTVATFGDTDVAIYGDQELLQRMFFNLFQNAVQHAPPDSVVTVDVGVADGAVHIRVGDRGKGIAPEDVTRIFDRFVQLDPSRRSEGAGLGLTIARWVAEIHDGALMVESSSPRGTTFRVSIPISKGVPGVA